MEDKNQAFRIKVKSTILSDRRFVQCCFSVCKEMVGDFEQRMLFGSFELAMTDLIRRMENLPAYDFSSSGGIDCVFKGMGEAFLSGNFDFFKKHPKYVEANALDSKKFSAIPLAVEAFDGEEAYMFRYDGQWRFVWRQWETKEVNFIDLDRGAFVKMLKSALIE